MERAGISYEHYLASVSRYHDEDAKAETEHRQRLQTLRTDEEKRAYREERERERENKQKEREDKYRDEDRKYEEEIKKAEDESAKAYQE